MIQNLNSLTFLIGSGRGASLCRSRLDLESMSQETVDVDC
jgi:hypothetical protein